MNSRADKVAGEDIKDNGLWEQALNILAAAQDCLRVLEEKGVLRTTPASK